MLWRLGPDLQSPLLSYHSSHMQSALEVGVASNSECSWTFPCWSCPLFLSNTKVHVSPLSKYDWQEFKTELTWRLSWRARARVRGPAIGCVGEDVGLGPARGCVGEDVGLGPAIGCVGEDVGEDVSLVLMSSSPLPRSIIGCIQNGFLAYDALGVNYVPILHQN